MSVALLAYWRRVLDLPNKVQYVTRRVRETVEFSSYFGRSTKGMGNIEKQHATKRLGAPSATRSHTFLALKIRRCGWTHFTVGAVLSFVFCVGNANADFDASIQAIYCVENNRKEVYQLGWGQKRVAEYVAAIMDAPDLKGPYNGAYNLTMTTAAERLRLCDSEAYPRQPSAARCTAFLVGPDVAVTAGHCVKRTSLKKKRLVLGYSVARAGEIPRSVADSQVFRIRRLLHRDIGSRADVAVIQLEREMPCLWCGFPRVAARNPSLLMLKSNSRLLGHPMGLPQKSHEPCISHEWMEKWASGRAGGQSGNDWLVLPVDAFHGNSGSPLFSGNDIVGMLTAGNEDLIQSDKGSCNEMRRYRPGERGELLMSAEAIRLALQRAERLYGVRIDALSLGGHSSPRLMKSE